MNSIGSAVFMGFGVAVALVFFGIYFSKGNYHAAVWWGMLAAIFTCVTVAFMAQDWLDRKKAAGAAERKSEQERLELVRLADQHERQIRPYVDAFNPVLSPLKAGQPARARVTLRNTGKTPAVDVMVGAKIQIGGFPLFTDTAYSNIDEPRTTLGAGSTLVIEVESEHIVTRHEIEGLRRGDLWLKVHGEVVFSAEPAPTTPFKHPHFCFVMERLNTGLQACDNFGDHTDRGTFR